MNLNRPEQIAELKNRDSWDILVIGGGASGLGVALDAVSRGLKVCLVEKYDFGKGTSSRSTKLVHGGVRYLEQGNIALVKEVLRERAYILTRAPHLSRVQPFVVPCYSWVMLIYYYIGLKVYDVLAGEKSLGDTEWLSKSTVMAKIPNIKSKGLRGGVLYMDGQFDDTRLCIDLVKTIVHHGGTCTNYTEVTSFLKDNGKTVGVVVRDTITDIVSNIKATHVVNATGVFSDDIVQMDSQGHRKTIIPSRGSHIVLDYSFLGGKDAIMIPKTSDGRVLFVIPWNGKVIVGTTDEKIEHPILEPYATPREIDFILTNCHKYLIKKPTREDILTTYAGLRPLAAPKAGSQKTKEISRGHKVIVSASGMVSIIGGKWTTYRKMGEDVLHKITKKWKTGYPKSNSINIDIIGKGLYSDIDRIHPSLPYTMDDIKDIIKNELVMTIEDILCRRTRCLFLDSKATLEVMTPIGNMLKTHLDKTDEWLSEQIAAMTKLIDNYKI